MSTIDLDAIILETNRDGSGAFTWSEVREIAHAAIHRALVVASNNTYQMSQLQKLLDEFYPTDTEISHIQREAFEKGWYAREQDANTGPFAEYYRIMGGVGTPKLDPIPTEDLDKSLDTIERLQKEFKPLKP